MRFILLTLLMATACGSTCPVLVNAPSTEGTDKVSAFRLRHQIMARNANDVHVFEGYMILQENSFVVKAFAGPGVDLFTVARHENKHLEQAHIAAIKNNLDLEAVGLDIARAYSSGCKEPASEVTLKCELLGFEVSETYDSKGRLLKRIFPKAYESGLKIEYSDYIQKLGRNWAERITLKWGEKDNEMVIRLLDLEALPPQDMSFFVKPADANN